MSALQKVGCLNFKCYDVRLFTECKLHLSKTSTKDATISCDITIISMMEV